ncbi:MAG: hypothetical protein CLLPBCKN_004857 [Chroococcidiopsis cubana SAG 39.79]|uniref:Methyltransferase small domain-containing protein n=1 Tax=Chroococcidiopsis cubana SAG 39.79 TaxID=388085 RepID=A0AB37UJS4_9CYAN|nr:hypothetical protein [Chroococcidiopsis cubana SAG 39.79]RUT11614.1 hypothetical protein DSM107010_31010 [Chroococcidiopsis cubana SAG 39.79]
MYMWILQFILKPGKLADEDKNMPENAWNTSLYESKHAFVWQYGESLLELLSPLPGERILDLGYGTGQLSEKIAIARDSQLNYFIYR